MRISDWSSDVCSSDLLGVRLGAGKHGGDDFPSGEMPLADRRAEIGDAVALEALDDRLQRLFRHVVAFLAERLLQDQIGRASCRERVCQYVEISVVAVSLNTKKT